MHNFLSFHQSFTDACQVIEKQSILIFDGLVSVSFHSPGLSIAFEHGLCKDGASSNQAPIICRHSFGFGTVVVGKRKLYVINKSNFWEGKSIHSHFNGSLPRQVPEIIRKHLPLILSTHPFEAFVILQQVSPWELNKMTATRQCQLFD